MKNERIDFSGTVEELIRVLFERVPKEATVNFNGVNVGYIHILNDGADICFDDSPLDDFYEDE